jgi:hypothetical protein
MVSKGFGKVDIAACILVSALITVAFYIMAIYKSIQSDRYAPIDAYAGAVFVFILSMIVSVSIIPPLIKKFGGGK